LPEGVVLLGNNQTSLTPEYEMQLLEACKFDNLEMFRWIFEASGISTEYRIRGQVLIHSACASHSSTIVDYLICHGADVTVRDEEGDTPLGRLFSNRLFHQKGQSILKQLLSLGDDVVGGNQHDDSTLMLWATLALTEETQHVLDVILAHGIDCAFRNCKGQNVWHKLASNTDGSAMANLLISKVGIGALKSGVDVSDKEG
jgi:ankyrin repeat protein